MTDPVQETLINATQLARTMYEAVATPDLSGHDLVVAASILYVSVATAVGLDKTNALGLIDTCPIWDADPKEFRS